MLLIWFLLVAIMITGLRGPRWIRSRGGRPASLHRAHGRRQAPLLIRTIGPVWDGNEVWLLAGGGTLYFAFPLLYASGFSGFYLPLMMVLWLLILRGIGIELRAHVDSPVWRGLFDGCFGIGSLLLTIFFGAAIGNVIRGVPLPHDGYFFLPLWTNWNVVGEARHSGLVHGDRGSGGTDRAVAARSQLCGAENQREIECAGAQSRRGALDSALAAITVVSLAATLYDSPQPAG